MDMGKVLINGKWRTANFSSMFASYDPAAAAPIGIEYPVSTWDDCDEALTAASIAFQELRELPAAKIADFLDAFAARIEAAKESLVDMANRETALPKNPRLEGNELPRTTSQLRQAAIAARDGGWALPTIDTKLGLASQLEAIGPVVVFGPNNFPFAFNSVAGGDFAAAIAAGCPVIAKANTSHPATTELLAREAFAAVEETKLPKATVQLIYRTSHADGEKLVSDHRIGAIGYTGSRHAGLTLKTAADRAGKPIYLELSSVNPVVILPGALAQRADDIAAQFTTSCLMGTGQFCTNPGLVVLIAGEATEVFIAQLVSKFAAAPVGTLLSAGVAKSLATGVATLTQSGAQVLVGGSEGGGKGFSFSNTLLRASGQQFLRSPAALQTEAFGNASLIVVCESPREAAMVLSRLEGNLTGCIYSHTAGDDDESYQLLASQLRQKVGRLINDKMPTGVAVSSAMNHGGPYPATGHPGFTAVGIPASLRRFGMLACYDGVRDHRLPATLQKKNPTGTLQRLIDGTWTTADVNS